IMLKNYFKMALRNIIKNKLNSILNAAGLSLGIAISMLIIFHVKVELSYDNNFPKADRIFRVTQGSTGDVSSRIWAATSFPLALRIKNEIPGIEQTARFYYAYTRILSYTPPGGEPRKFEETGGYHADPTAIDMFNLRFIKGNPGNALNPPNSIVLTGSMAKKYFLDEEPLGKNIIDDALGVSYLVTGVIEDLPHTTHLKFDYLLSMSTFYRRMIRAGNERLLNSVGWNALYTYILIHNNQTRENVEAKLPDFTAKYFANRGTREEVLANTALHLQPIKEIHLHSNLEKEMNPNSRIEYIYIFSIIALFILLIAGVNFINISTAQAFKRIKEVGVRKVVGARRQQLVIQFLGESILLSAVSAVAAVLLIRMFLPLYNNFSGYKIHLLQLLSPDFLLFFILITVLIGTTAGLYPALFMSAFKPANTFKAISTPKSTVSSIKKGLVIFQFVISIFMIFSSIVIYMQMEFFRSKDLGFDKERLVAIRLYGNLYKEAVENANALKSELLGHSAISGAARAGNIPGNRFSASDFIFKGLPGETARHNMRHLFVDEEFLETLNIDLVRGRSFSGLSPGVRAFILNETAANLLNVENPLGLDITSGISGNKGSILGVVRNFNYASLHNNIEPLIMEFSPGAATYLIVRMNNENIRETLEFIEKKVNEIAPGHLLIYTFIEDHFTRLYASEDRIGKIFNVFSLLALFISCLGLFGLSAHSAQQRIKEIGVRKVLGASSSNIVLLLSREFVIWVITANIFALPIAWFAMNKWLQNFAYRVNIGTAAFFISGILALLIALVTVSYRAIKVARANPVNSLRYE
ncbi:MAG: ABC transporter permease, partial [Candidatus Aminicenantes bacterium]